MRVMFILDYSFPSSNAPSNRIEALCKGFLRQGHLVDVLSLRGTWLTKNNRVTDERIKVYFSGSKYRSEIFIKRNLNKFIGVVRSFVIILKENKKIKISAVFIPANQNILSGLILVFLKILKIKVLQERSEYPEIYKRTLYEKIGYYFYTRILIKFLDGMIVMTNNLKNYYSKILSSRSLITIIPMSVDADRFETGCEILKENCITYCGNLNNNKDGVDILIRAFSEIAVNHKEWNLLLIGGAAEDELTNLKNLCKEMNIEDKVIFEGEKESNEIPYYLNRSKILALARPSSLQAHGGFPTKLGEYLATKNPVVVTNVGEIGYYLVDGESAFISEPDSVKLFSIKLDECISNYDRSKNIGLNGYQVALSNFDFKAQAKSLNDFLVNLSER